MIMKSLSCPYCGGDLKEFDKNKVHVCPYCGKKIYFDNERSFTYQKIYTKEDKARIREAEAEEAIRSQEIAFEKEKYFDKAKRENRKMKLVIAASLIALIVLALIGRLVALEIDSRKKDQMLHDQLIVNQNTPEETIIQEDNGQETKKVSKRTLQAAVSSASEIVTYKYYYTNLGESEKDKKLFKSIPVPFSKEKTLFTYDGVIAAGYDLRSVKINVDNMERVITVTLPQARILSHEIDMDSFKIYDIKKSIFTSMEMEEYTEYIKALKKKQEENLNDKEEFWEQVRAGAEVSVKELLEATGETGDYTITFAHKGPMGIQ